jgi:hypothetical protein
MTNTHPLVSADGSERVFLIPCPCGDCYNTSLIVERRVRRNKWRRLELTLSVAALTMLEGIIEEIKAYHQDKDDE